MTAPNTPTPISTDDTTTTTVPKKRSWKTTWAGIIGAIGAFLAFILPWLKDSHDPRLQALGGLLLAMGVGGVGAAGRDNKVSDQDVRARPEPSTTPAK